MKDFTHERRGAPHLIISGKGNRAGGLKKALTPDAIYKLVREYSNVLGFEIGAHALCATAATNALDHLADLSKLQEWLGYANIATTRIYDHRKTRPEDSLRLKSATDFWSLRRQTTESRIL